MFCSVSLHRSFSLGTARSSSRSSDSLVDPCKRKIEWADSVTFYRRYLFHVDANSFYQQLRYCTISMTIHHTNFWKGLYGSMVLWHWMFSQFSPKRSIRRGTGKSQRCQTHLTNRAATTMRCSKLGATVIPGPFCNPLPFLMPMYYLAVWLVSDSH